MSYEIEGVSQRLVDVGDVTLSVHEAGAGPAVVLCHGFPELAYSWRRQLPALAEAGFRAIAPDQRGYGGSSRPPDVADYDIFHLTGDLVGLLDALDIDRAVFVGHDWGGFVVWQMPLLHRERVAGVVGVNTPYVPRLPVRPTDAFRMAGGDDHYIVWFQQPEIPEAVLSRDVPALFDALLRTAVPPEDVQAAVAATTGGSPFERISESPRLGAPLLDPTELAVYVDAFTETGFGGGINWYRNFDRNWEATPDQDGAHIDGIPCLMVTAEWDPVLVPALASAMPTFVEDLEVHQLERCGHWTMQEQPDELNAVLVDWLTRRFAR